MNNIYGFETAEATFICNETVEKGATVTFNEYGEVIIAESSDLFCGVVTDVRNDCCSVVLKGHVRVSYNGITPSMGYSKLVADGDGKAMVSDAGRHILVVAVDETNKTIDIIL